MVKARVELVGAASHHTLGRVFKVNQPQILTDPSEIRKYQNMGDFSVEVITDKERPIKPELNGELKDKSEQVDTATPKNEANDYTFKELMKFKKVELAEIAGELGLDATGTRSVLMKRILNG